MGVSLQYINCKMNCFLGSCKRYYGAVVKQDSFDSRGWVNLDFGTWTIIHQPLVFSGQTADSCLQNIMWKISIDLVNGTKIQTHNHESPQQGSPLDNQCAKDLRLNAIDTLCVMVRKGVKQIQKWHLPKMVIGTFLGFSKCFTKLIPVCLWLFELGVEVGR